MSDQLQNNKAQRIQALVALIAESDVTLESLSPEDRALVENELDFDLLEAELALRVSLHGLDWSALCQAWLGDGKSENTVIAYKRALRVFDSWCEWQRVDPLRLSTGQADEFILYMRRDAVVSPKTVLETAKAISGLYQWVGRSHGLANPFQGTRAKPRPQSPPPRLPLAGDLEALTGVPSPVDALAVLCLAFLGLPLESLPTLTIVRKFRASYQGRQIEGPLPVQIREFLPGFREFAKTKGIDATAPLVGLDVQGLSTRFGRWTARMAKKEQMSQALSLTDLRYSWAKREWEATGDVLAIKERLGHSQVTQTAQYLSRVGIQV